MSALIRTTQTTRRGRTRWLFLLAAMALAALAVFLLLPGSIASKTHLALHGICAQRPSHSLYLGENALPLDARMTGIYLAAAVTIVWLFAAGNAHAMKAPRRSTVGVLVACVAIMAADGLNALAVDLALPHPYAPANGLRLLTGVLAGTALGAGVVHLAVAAFPIGRESPRKVAGGAGALAIPMAVAGAIGTLALTGLPVLYGPFAIGLVVAATGVYFSIATITLALVTCRTWPRPALTELAPVACGGLLAALSLMAGLAALRLVLETRFGWPLLT